jgi:hypothetical protein
LSRALQLLVTGIKLHDAWKQGGTKVYTHYATISATRKDRIYVSELLLQRKRHIEIIAAAFTDQLAVSMYIDLPTDRCRERERLLEIECNIVERRTGQSDLQE